MLRLLSKSDIDKQKATDKAREVAEGLKLSRRVDTLRELQAKEEKTLDDWRTGTLANIQGEISDLGEKKEVLNEEILILRKKLDKMLPDMQTDRIALHELRKALEKREIDTKLASQELDLKEIDIAIAIKDSNDALKRAMTREETAKKLHLRADEEKNEAEQIKLNAQHLETRVLNVKKEVEESLIIKENNLTARGKEIALQEEENIRISQELATEKIQLADQRKTLERALARIKNNRL